MSLLTLLGEQGPVRDWFASNFPNTAAVSSDANRSLRGGSGKEPCLVPPVPGSDAALVGTAVGYVLSAHLRENALEQTVARHGARILDRPLRTLEPSPASIERHAVERVRELAPWEQEHPLASQEWDELLRLSVLLARFEQIYRAGLPAVEYLIGPLVRHGRNLDTLTRMIAAEPTLADLDALGRATIEDHCRDLRAAKPLRIGPTFDQSVALGGADADLIAGGALIELKSTGQPGIMGRKEAWQLLGYLFADTDDRHAIERCSVFALRRRRTCFWDAQELVDALAGGSSQSIADWRTDFARVLVPVAAARERRLAERTRTRPRRR